MKQIITIFFLAFLFLPSSTYAGITIYETYEDYQADKGEKYDSYHNHLTIAGSVRLILKKGGKKMKVNCKNIWGFKYDDALFRVDSKFNQPTKVVHEGDLIYYENGLAHLDMIKQKTEFVALQVGYFSYFSKDINSELVPVPAQGQNGGKRWKKFKGENGKFRKLFNCVDESPIYYSIRECVKRIKN